MKRITNIFLILFTLWFFHGCATNPVTGKRDLMLLSEEQEIAMGREADPQIVASMGLYDDQELQQFIERKGQAMARVSHRPDLPYEFKIVDTDVVNAFAVPGGYIYFTRGIMAHFNNEAEFAGVLGHEIGHVTARHSARQYSKAQLASIGMGVGMIFSDTFRQFSDFAGQGLQLLFLKFGRDAERQSDQLGVEYSTKTGYDSYEMAGFFETLDRMGPPDDQVIPTFLSTHPDPIERTQNVRRQTEKWQRKENLQDPEVNRNSYLRMIDGIVYGPDPRQGYVEDNRFYHPELKFKYDVPANWLVQNSPQQVQMAPRDGNAIMALTLAQGSSPREAASQFIQQYELTSEASSETTVNGFNAFRGIASQSDQQGNVVRVLYYFIQDGERIYFMYGATSGQDFDAFQPIFSRSITSFSRLTDSRYINRKPTRINIREVPHQGNLKGILTSFGMPAEDLDELALINGMQLTDQVSAGTLIKTFTQN